MYGKDEVRQIAHKFVDIVRQEYDPLRMVLFGSYVNGTPHEYSDIDIAVVFNDYKGDWLRTWSDLFGMTMQVALDIEPHMMDAMHDSSGFLEHIMETGETIYDKIKSAKRGKQ